MLLSGVVPDNEAAQYARKFDSMNFAVRKLRSEEEDREAIAAQQNPLGVEGEVNVNYMLKWWLSSHPGYIMVASDCFSQYSASCIRLAAWDFMREPQEIDHLLVGPAGVIHIETKDYIGSITVDADLMEAAGMQEYQQVQVANIDNGARLVTYLIAGKPGSGVICLNGAAAHCAKAGDKVILMSYIEMKPEQAKHYRPKVVFVDEENRITRIARYEKQGQLFEP